MSDISQSADDTTLMRNLLNRELLVRDLLKQNRTMCRILRGIPRYSKDGTWGRVVYRTTYSARSDTVFPQILERIQDYIHAQVLSQLKELESIDEWKVLEDERGMRLDLAACEEMMKYYKMIVMDDKEKLDGLSIDGVRAHFEEWVKGLPDPTEYWQKVRERSIRNGGNDEVEDWDEYRGIRDKWPRYRACILVDDEVLNALALVPPEAEYAKTCCEGSSSEWRSDYWRMRDKWYVKAEPWWDVDSGPEQYEGWMKVSLFCLSDFWHSMEDIPMEVAAEAVFGGFPDGVW